MQTRDCHICIYIYIYILYALRDPADPSIATWWGFGCLWVVGWVWMPVGCHFGVLEACRVFPRASLVFPRACWVFPRARWVFPKGLLGSFSRLGIQCQKSANHSGGAIPKQSYLGTKMEPFGDNFWYNSEVIFGQVSDQIWPLFWSRNVDIFRVDLWSSVGGNLFPNGRPHDYHLFNLRAWKTRVSQHFKAILVANVSLFSCLKPEPHSICNISTKIKKWNIHSGALGAGDTQNSFGWPSSLYEINDANKF